MADTTNRPAPIYFILAILYYGALTVVSHIPGNTLSSLSPHVWDKALHFGAYLVLGGLVALGLSRRSIRVRSSALLAFIGALILVLGGIDEIHQSFIPGRQMSAGDAAADALGGMFGAFLVLSIHPVRAVFRRFIPRGS